MTDTLLYTIAEVAEIMSVNKNYVYSLIRNGLLPALKLGSLKVRKDALVKFLADFEGMDLTNPEKVCKLAYVNG